MEHRWGRRIPVDMQVQLVGYPASVGWGRLRDVSLSGGFIETALSLRPLSSVEVILQHDGARHGNRTAIRAIVVRQTPQGLGVEWVDETAEVAYGAARTRGPATDPTLGAIGSRIFRDDAECERLTPAR